MVCYLPYSAFVPFTLRNFIWTILTEKKYAHTSLWTYVHLGRSREGAIFRRNGCAFLLLFSEALGRQIWSSSSSSRQKVIKGQAPPRAWTRLNPGEMRATTLEDFHIFSRKTKPGEPRMNRCHGDFQASDCS